jgi:hypothetical protein
LVLAWVFVPSAAWTCHSMAWEIGDGALRGAMGVGAPVLAYLPFGILAALGWRAGAQLSASRTRWTGGQDA